jgi:DNA-binding NtrC family response regulator
MCVLLVEDDVAIRLTLVDFLEDVGLRVIDAWDASTALCIVNKPPEIITVLITDLSRGSGDNGLMLAAKARLKIPNLRVVYETGSPEMLRNRLMRPWERVFIKPFDASRLASEVLALDQALQSSSGAMTSNAGLL